MSKRDAADSAGDETAAAAAAAPAAADAKRAAVAPAAAGAADAAAAAAATTANDDAADDKSLFGAADAEQVRLMGERCILLNERDEPIGYETKKTCHLVANFAPPRALLHRAFSVFLFSPDGERLLLQQRAAEKITFPSFWTNTVCSHPLEGEEEEMAGQRGVRMAARRKLVHELGIAEAELPALDDFHFLTRIHYKAASDPVWGEHEIDYILITQPKTAPKLAPSANEVSDTRYVTRDELRTLLEQGVKGENGVKITPWFKLICDKFLFKWWDKLDKLDDVAEPDVIHKLVQ